MIIFEPGTDPERGGLERAEPHPDIVKNRLPPLVEREGIIVMQAMTSMLMYVNIFSTDPKAIDQNFLYNYAFSQGLLPEIKRTPGHRQRHDSRQPRSTPCGSGSNLDRMRAYNVSADDVMKAVKRDRA